MIGSMVSGRTRLLFIVGLIFIVALAFAISSGIGGENVSVALSDGGEFAIVLFSALFVIWVARTFSPGESVRRQWMAIGIGMFSFAIGDAIWTYIEVVRGLEPPYPGLPDLFYLIEYPLIAFGLIRAGLAYRGLISLRRPAVMSAALTVALGGVLWFGLLQPHILFADIPAGEKLLSALYPVADLVLYIGPALFVAVVVSTLGGGRLAWPWWAVVIGVSALALADAGYSWLSAYDLYQSGSFIDYGWSTGHLMLAVGASVLYDLAHPLSVGKPRVDEAEAAA